MFYSKRWAHITASTTMVAAVMFASATALLAPASHAAEHTGKIVAIFHEPVVISQKTYDKVSVTVHDCKTNQFVTGHYAPGHVSDSNAPGSLFRNTGNAARANTTKNQYMQLVNGHATLTLNDTSKEITKTTLWGYNWECGTNLSQGSVASTGSSSMPAAGNTTSPQATPAAAPASANPLKRFGKFGRFGR